MHEVDRRAIQIAAARDDVLEPIQPLLPACHARIVGQTVLDNTTFYMSSDIADGNTHNHYDMPILMAGRAGGKLNVDGAHVNYTPALKFPRPLIGERSDVHTGRALVSVLQAHGIMQDTFGEATGGPLPELMNI